MDEMVKMVNIHQAKTHLSRYVAEAAAGKELIIAKAGKPLAKLVPYRQITRNRELGALQGQIEEAPGCWSAEVDAEIAQDLLGGAGEPGTHGDGDPLR